MQKAQPRLTVALLFVALALLAFFGTAFLSGPIDFIYRSAAGLSAARNAAQMAALAATAAIFVAGLIVAVRAALQPTRRLGKLLHVLPIYALGFTLVGIVSALIGVGTVGTLLTLQGVGPVNFAAAWLAVGAVVSTITVVIAAARVQLSGLTLRAAAISTAITTVLGLLATIAMIASAAIVSTSQPSTGGFGGQFPPGGQGGRGQGGAAAQSTAEAAPNRQGVFPAATSEAPFVQSNAADKGAFAASAPAATAEVGQNNGAAPNRQGNSGDQGVSATSATPSGENNGAASAPQNGQRGQGRPEGQFPPGGPGGFGNSVEVGSRYAVGGVLMAVFEGIALISAASALLALRAGTPQPTAPLNYGREAGFAVLSCAALTVILVAIIQIPPVSRTNPPVQTTVHWDSAQTKDLAYRACMNCHSDETTWPWYAYVAPASWLTTMHVTNGRQQYNLSELNNLPAFRKAMLADQIAMQIHSGAMPPKDYQILHPEARLTDAEKQALIAGFQKSLAAS